MMIGLDIDANDIPDLTTLFNANEETAACIRQEQDKAIKILFKSNV